MKKVSVIIPFYKNKKWLKESLDSVFSQTHKNIEVFLINDGSPEDISDVLNKYNNKILYYYQKNSGPGAARNIGLLKATGDYIAFLDSDDIWEKNYLRFSVEYLENTQYEWCHCYYTRFWDNDYSHTQKVENNFSGTIFPLAHIWFPIGPPFVMIRRKIFLENKNLKFSNNRFGEDCYLFKLIGEKYPLGLLKKNLCKIRMRGSNAMCTASVQLEARGGNCARLLKCKKQFTNPILFYFIYFNSKMCYILSKIISFIPCSLCMKEIIAKSFYVFPYSCFRIARIMLNNPHNRLHRNHLNNISIRQDS